MRSMPNLVLNASDVFPVGTTVGAYPANAVLPRDQRVTGTALESIAVATDGTATFVTLAADTPYVFAATVNGTPRAVRQRLSSYTAPPTWGQTIIDRKAAMGTA